MQVPPPLLHLSPINSHTFPLTAPAKFLPSNTPLTPPPTNQPEIVLFVGYPCVGKTTTFKRHFQPHGYVHVNQDTLKSRDRCIKAVGVALDEGKSCVVGEPTSYTMCVCVYVLRWMVSR